ncbi:MAG TPA: hypothetical protein PLG30_14110, partial [Bacteroidia bacterium]|nr:hypothetical protein [Bacteroidia bacterium]
EDVWLNNTTLNPATDPDLIDYYDDAVASALASDAGEVMIGTDLYVIDTQGEMWVLPNATCNDIPGLSNDPAVLANTPQVKTIHGGFPLNDCKNNWRHHGLEPYDSNKQLKWKLKFTATHWGGDGTKAYAKTVSYKKKANGKWKNFKTNLLVKSSGNWTTNCADFTAYSEQKTKRRNRLKAPAYDGGFYRYHKIGEAHGYYEATNYNFNFTKTY